MKLQGRGSKACQRNCKVSSSSSSRLDSKELETRRKERRKNQEPRQRRKNQEAMTSVRCPNTLESFGRKGCAPQGCPQGLGSGLRAVFSLPKVISDSSLIRDLLSSHTELILSFGYRTATPEMLLPYSLMEDMAAPTPSP